MPEHTHNLPTRFNRLDDQITGPVLDSIMIYPRSRGTLHLPGEYGTASHPPAHAIKVVSTDPDSPGVDIEPVERGSAEHFTLSYDIWNNQDSPAFARITLTDHPGQLTSTMPPLAGCPPARAAGPGEPAPVSWPRCGAWVLGRGSLPATL